MKEILISSGIGFLAGVLTTYIGYKLQNRKEHNSIIDDLIIRIRSSWPLNDDDFNHEWALIRNVCIEKLNITNEEFQAALDEGIETLTKLVNSKRPL